ncbi:S8 family serine peptidase [Streptomyces sp. NPDC059979]|uniref:S8 family serine peptidase n=1 Tax=Streptomyces sp. NPDC059979 TaxID=3347021 RepID=UPI003676354B
MQHRAVPKKTGALVLGAAVALLAGILSPAAQATPADRPAAAPATPERARTVTLITGDKVTLTPGPAGAPPVVTVQRPANATGSVRTVTDDTGTYVYPADAETHVAQGLLDKRLFNVTDLVAQGYDDETSPAGLPLIISRDTEAGRLAAADLPGVSLTRQLDSVRAVAATTDRREPARLWDALNPAGQSAAGRGAASSLPGAVDKIWLDGKVKAALADSTAQIGAPQVWDQGATGAGVKVAVLDTGVDAAHPDLAQRIVSTHSFIPGEDVTDRRGHGTHVASIIAGTGAASAGKEKGVAPGANLAIGKVLSDVGIGTESGIIAGLEWAAVAERAKIINMSLGNASAHTQDDPMSQAVNALSAQTGALFVIAAGNSGPGPTTVNAPGTAASALTVGAVDATDAMAGFSSSGPRAGDGGLKPDLTAPGVSVLAARSQHLPGEGPYTAKSGTSMATPHVAGAAALLAGKHPDWTGQQLKDALMSTTKPTADTSAYRGGTGRTDVAAAFRAQITASGAIDTGLIKWSADPQPAEHKITYTNTGDSAVTLQLAVDRQAAPAGLFTLKADSVTVPARASAQVSLAVDPRGAPIGGHTGQVLAKDSAGTVLAHTVLNARTESEHHDLTLRAKDRGGKPMTGTAMIVPAGAPYQRQSLTVPEAGLTLHLPRDHYSVTMFTDVEGAHGTHSKGMALLGDPEVELTAPRSVTFDASQARQVRALTPQPSMATGTRVEYWRSFTTRTPQYGTSGDWIESKVLGPEYDSVWAQPTPEKVNRGGFIFTTRWRAPQTPLTVSSAGDELDVLVQKGAKALPEGTTTTATVFAGTGTPAEYAGLSAAGKVAVVRRTAAVSPQDQAQAAHAAGAKLLLVVNDVVGRLNTWYGLSDNESSGPVPVASVTRGDGEALISRISVARGDKPRLKLTAHPTTSYLYDLVSSHAQGIPQDPTYRPGPSGLARVNQTFGQGPAVRATEARTDFPAYAFNGVMGFWPDPEVRGSRTDWVSAGTDVIWQQKVTAENRLTETSERVSYPKAGTHTERWITPLMRPRMITEDLPVRQYGGTLKFEVPAWGGNGTAHAGEGYAGGGLSQRTSLYQGETLIDQFDHSSGYIGGLPEEARPYRIVVDAANDGSGVGPYSATTHTEWSFVSAAAEQQTLPLVQLDYAVDLDADGKARRTAPLHVTPLVLGAPGTKASAFGLEVSYDDGATWHRPKTVHRDGTWKASLNAPASASFVSLRTTATDGKDGRIAQTVIRAYGLK